RRAPGPLTASVRLGVTWWGPALALVVLVIGTVLGPGSGAGPGLGPASSAAATTPGVRTQERSARRPPARRPPAKKPPAATPGVGLRTPRDGWAGTWTVKGRRAFAVDLDSRDPSTATGFGSAYAKSLHVQVGWTKDHREGGAASVKGPALSSQALAQLAYLTDRYATATSAATTAAAEHAVLTLTAVDKAQAAREKARWAAVVKARGGVKAAYDAVAADVRDHAGPYSLTTAWMTAASAFAAGRLAVKLVSAAGKPMTGVRITSRATSAPTAVSVPATTDATGTVTLTVPVRARGALGVTLTAADLPATVPILYTPLRFRDRRSADALAQRLVGPSPRATLKATASAAVAAAVPVVTTRANPATPAITSRLTDDVTLTGTVPGYAGRVVASLWGPFPASPAPGDCTPVTTKLAARVTVDVSGDGIVTTPPVTVVAPGYYTWVEDVPGTSLQDEVVTTCGDPKETFAVPGVPSLSLAVAGQPAPGEDLDAQLTMRGSFPGLAAPATLTLFGPFATPPTSTSCTATTVADTTTTTLQGDGTTTAATITAATTGYYTWTVNLPSAGKTQASASIPCADPQTVFAVTRPDIGALDVTTTGSIGATAPGPPPPAGGPMLSAASASIAAPVVTMPLNPPGLAVPSDYSLTGQLDVGAHVGDQWGTVIVAGRVGDVHGAPGALSTLSHVQVGDTIRFTDVDGLTGNFRVTSVTTRPRTDVLPADLFAQSGPLRLTILSTTDPVLFGGGLITYRSHVIVTATAA
ncbi:MAG: class F sortase, partial [Kineosporiaceae bacterium]